MQTVTISINIIAQLCHHDFSQRKRTSIVSDKGKGALKSTQPTDWKDNVYMVLGLKTMLQITVNHTIWEKKASRKLGKWSRIQARACVWVCNGGYVKLPAAIYYMVSFHSTVNGKWTKFIKYIYRVIPFCWYIAKATKYTHTLLYSNPTSAFYNLSILLKVIFGAKIRRLDEGKNTLQTEKF